MAGFIGVILAIILFCRNQKLDIVRIGDGIACAAPFGLCFGRIANFINGEIVGQVDDGALGASFSAMRASKPLTAIAPSGDLPRHPAQLYEAFLEGVALLLILYVLVHAFKILRRPGFATGCLLHSLRGGTPIRRDHVPRLRQQDRPHRLDHGRSLVDPDGAGRRSCSCGTLSKTAWAPCR